MIRVNLLATSHTAAQPKLAVPKEQKPAMMGLAMLLVTGVSVGGWWYYLGSQRASTESSIATAETTISQLTDALKLLETARQQKAELEERVALIEKLRAAKTAPVRLLDLVNEVLPEGLWLIEIKQSGAAVQLEGRSMSHTAVADFAEQLQKAGYFKMPVEIVTTLMEQVEETNVIRFVLKGEPIGSAGAPKATTKPTAAGRPGA
jgi:type IV pilus assembly protein PilN